MPIRRILLVLLLSLPQGALAECFCLIDEDDVVWFDCVSQKRPLKPNPDRDSRLTKLASELGKGQYRLLLQTKDILVKIKPHAAVPAVLVPLAEIEAVLM